MDERLEQPALVMTASWRRTAAALCAAIFAVGGSAYGDDRIEFFEKKIRPVLVAHCYECHGAKKQKGKLRLDSAPALRRGGENGIVIEPGDAASSSLWQALNYDGSEMPPAKQLPKSVIADFKKWIDDGAVDPRKNVDAEPSLQAARSHWAFQPISSPAPPNARSSWAVNPIDLFIDARLRAAGMQPAAAADRLTLARRLYLDLTGLPPTRREIESFVDDPRPDAWERLVDRLLASPQYGERLARQWMDIVRYTETAGHVQDRVRPHAWRYRDWLIDAFNDDLAYDRFVMEHIAGDLVEARPGRGGEQNVAPAATGWMWFHEMHFRPVDPILQRADQVDAQIDVLGKAFLGLTLSCVRCHDHKFDPIVLADYYALAGFFHSTVERHARLAEPSRLADADQQKAVERLRGEIAATIARETKSVRQRQSKKTTDSLPLTEINFTPGAQRKLQSLRDQLSEIDWSFAQWSPAAADGVAQDVAIHEGGSHQRLGRVVRRSMPAFFASAAPKFEGSGRLYLAEQIASSDNPLTARVLVNRLWQRHFGRGLCETPNELGLRANRPTHPDLLNWLAASLVRNGWSIKTIDRLIVTSRTYRMSGSATPAAIAADPKNLLWGRSALRRMDAEQLRDSILAACGVLSSRQFGRGVPPFVSPNATANKPINIPKSGPVDGARRRTVYLLVRRNFVTPFLTSFDFPDQGVSVGRRNETHVAPQSLALLNSPFVHQQAARWAESLLHEETADARIDQLYWRALGRPASRAERRLLLDVVAQSRSQGATAAESWADAAHVMFNLDEFVFVR